jgi:hypothetical protein
MAELGADSGKDIEGFTDHLPGDDWAERFRRPTSSQGIEEPKPALIFGHDQDRARILSCAGVQDCLD